MEQGNGQPAGEGTAENGSANFEMDLYTETLDWWRQSVTFTPDEYGSVLSRDMEP